MTALQGKFISSGLWIKSKKDSWGPGGGGGLTMALSLDMFKRHRLVASHRIQMRILSSSARDNQRENLYN